MKLSGFEDEDVLVTAEFIQILNDLFDVLNSRMLYGPGYKGSVTIENSNKVFELFHKAKELFKILETEQYDKKEKKIVNVKMIHTLRNTPFLGLFGVMESIERMVGYMRSKVLPLSFIRTYKLCQDPLELLFNAVRLRNGWSFNPTARQFRTALRQLIVYAGKSILSSASANCTPQDSTSMLLISNKVFGQIKIEANTQDLTQIMEDFMKSEADDGNIELHGCKVENCKFCEGTIPYITGFIVFALKKVIKCDDCYNSLVHSANDPCPNKGLIRCKSYNKDYDENSNKGLCFPSGSTCTLTYLAEQIFRKHQRFVYEKTAVQKYIIEVLHELPSNLFPSLKENNHLTSTSDGADNHYFALIKLILNKYFRLRIKKVLKDQQKSQEGNKIHRLRIFKGL